VDILIAITPKSTEVGALFAASVSRILFIHYPIIQTIIMSVAHFSKQQQSASSTIPTYPPSGYHLTTKLPANAYNLQKRIALIINHLHTKTHETTGK
jgi:hypothetical protein